MRTSWRIFALLRDYKWLSLLGLALALTQTLLGLLVPRFIELTVDRALLGGETDLLVTYGLALLGIAVAAFFVAMCRRLVTGRVSLGIEYDLRDRLWNRLLLQPLPYFDRWPTGQLMSRAMNDIQNVRMFLGYGFVFLVTNSVTIVAVAVILLVLDRRLAVVSLAFLPLLLAVTLRFGRRLHPTMRRVQQRVAGVSEAAEENAAGTRIVRIFAGEAREIDGFRCRSREVREASIAAARTRAVYVPFIALAPNLAVALLLYYGGRLAIDGSLELGSLIAFYAYLMMIVRPARVIGTLMGHAQRAIASGERVYEVLDAPLEMTERRDAAALPPAAGAGAGLAVTFDDVSFGYGGRPVLRGVRLEVPAGRTVALVGATGCGKTTLTRLVPRFYDVSAGCVLVAGRDVRELPLCSLRECIGVVDQDPFLFSTTIAENLRFGRPEATDAELRAAARAAQAEEFIAQLPDGSGTVIGERGYTLSGGQRQRLALARALLMDPPILILDDATSSVDVETEAKIRVALREATRGRTTFIIAHRPSTIALADEVVVLDHGKIAEQGTHEELMGAGGLYAHLFGSAEAEHRDFDSVAGEEAVPEDAVGGGVR